MKVLFIDTAHPLLRESLEKDDYNCTDATTKSEEEILEMIHGYDGIVIRSRIPVDKAFLDAATNLKFIARVGAGMEGIDVAYAEKKGIKCLNSPEGNRNAVAEQALGMLLALLNNLITADRDVRKGNWIREENRGVELDGKTVGIIGYGNTGSAFARKLKGFDCAVLAYDKYKKGYADGHVKESTMEELCRQSDIVSLHVPLTPETHYMMNDDLINRFAKNIYILNTSRGLCLKTEDLVKNMQSGKVLGACLDVIEYEETSFEGITFHEMAWHYLLQSPKVVLSPHIAGWTYESKEKMARILFEKIRQMEIEN